MSIPWTTLRQKYVGDYDARLLPPKIQIPIMPHALMEFVRKADDPRSSPLELGRCIERDVGLTCELLRYVNSSAVGLRTKAATAQRAISLLGVHRTKLLLLAAAVQTAMKVKSTSRFNADNFSACNLERALFAQHFARAMGADPELAFAAAMLVDCLLPKLVQELPQLYAIRKPDVARPLVKVEQSALNWTHAAGAAQIMLGWQFPDDLICCVALHHETYAVLCIEEPLRSSAAAAVALAALLPDPVHQVPNGLDALFQCLAVHPGIDVGAISGAVAEEFQSFAIPLGNYTPATEQLAARLATA